MNRLKAILGGNNSWGIDWDLDPWGNRTGQTPSGIATPRVGSQTLAYSDNKNTSFTYDAVGNLTADALHTYSYDAESRIVAVDTGTIAFAYDSEGRRLQYRGDPRILLSLQSRPRFDP